MLTNSKRFDQFKHKLKDFHLPGSSSDIFFSLGISRIRTFCGQGVVSDGAKCGDAEHASSDERAEELHGSAANHNKVLREFFLTVCLF